MYSRHLKNVGSPGIYNVSFNAPPGISISVEPTSLKFDKYGDEKKFAVTFDLVPNFTHAPGHDHVFGDLTWSDGFHSVRSTIGVKV